MVLLMTGRFVIPRLGTIYSALITFAFGCRKSRCIMHLSKLSHRRINEN